MGWLGRGLSKSLQHISAQEQFLLCLILLAPLHHDPPTVSLSLSYDYFIILNSLCCIAVALAPLEQSVGHTVHSHYSYLDAAPVWLCPGPSVGFCSSISAICAFMRRLWGPRWRQNDWHFSGTTRGTVPRAFSCQWCALTLTKPVRVGGWRGGFEGRRRWKQAGGPGRKQLHLQYCSFHVQGSGDTTYPCNNGQMIHSQTVSWVTFSWCHCA